MKGLLSKRLELTKLSTFFMNIFTSKVYTKCYTASLFIYWLRLTQQLKIQRICVENCQIFYHKTNKEASTLLCSVVKHLRTGRALKKQGKTLNCVSCFPLQFVVLYRFVFVLQQKRAQSRLIWRNGLNYNQSLRFDQHIRKRLGS